MLKRGLALCAGLISLSVAGESLAQSVTTTIHHQYRSVRAMGMGDAQVASTRDYTAIFYNPAALARRTDGQLNLSMSYAATPGASSFYNEYSDIESSGLSDSDKNTRYLEMIERHYGDVYSLRLSPMEGYYVRPNWGIAFIPLDVTVETAMHRQLGPVINATAYADTTVAFGYGDDFKGFEYGQLSWGATAKFVNRGFFSKSMAAIDMVQKSDLIEEKDLLEGYTFDVDLGLLWTPNTPKTGFMSFLSYMQPTFGLVVRNAAEMGFGQSLKLLNKEELEGEPEKLHRVIDVGSNWEFPSAWIFGGRFAVDVRDMNHPDFTFKKGLHMGAEFDWTVSSWWKGNYRVGMSQGFWTAGVSACLGIFNLDIASYANDVGTQNISIESRVYEARLNLEF